MGTLAAVHVGLAADFIATTLPMPAARRPVLAVGAWLKNTLCLAERGRAHVSPFLGDLDTADACRAHAQTAHALLDWLGARPDCIAHDLHPDFYSTRLATTLAERLQIPLLAVQHHHAHIAAVAAENAVREPIIGLALDGVGLGTDGMAWGGELLLVHGAQMRRLGHFHPLPMPGGDRAAREPWRMAAAALHTIGRGGEIERRFAAQPAAPTVARMLKRSFNCPPTTSAGRLFDAASGLLGLCHTMSQEAQAACLLQQQAQTFGEAAPLHDGYRIGSDGSLDFRPLLAFLADCHDAAHGAAVFHATLAAGLASWAAAAARGQGAATVALGGGCFFNAVLVRQLDLALVRHGLKVLRPRILPPGDAAISLGQAWVALHFMQGN
ncbi:MAG: carbamoyltransferase HypF [Methylophilaceae bacterium]|nr:carbamoyltransferase HypF [Methylophilaceae bacterium]